MLFCSEHSNRSNLRMGMIQQNSKTLPRRLPTETLRTVHLLSPVQKPVTLYYQEKHLLVFRAKMVSRFALKDLVGGLCFSIDTAMCQI